MFFKKLKIKKQITAAQKALYSGEFDLKTILSDLGNLPPNSEKRISAYVTIGAVANGLSQKTNIPLTEILNNIEIYKNRLKLGSSELANLQEGLLEAKAEEALLEAKIEYKISELAPEWSLHGILFRAEKSKRGPLNNREITELEEKHLELSELESHIESLTDKDK